MMISIARNKTRTRLSLLSLITLAACGIDQGGVRVPAVTSQNIVVSGPITGFGSVMVNGLTLETAGADVRIDGAPAVESDLRIGQVIRAIATREGVATRAITIEYEENLVGPVELVDSGKPAFSVLGQVVRIDADTHFETPLTNDVADLAIDERVAVSGFWLSSGEILASYVGPAGPTAVFQITAPISSLNIPGLSFELGGLTVDYSRSALVELVDGLPELDTAVEVKGTTIVGGVLVADQVRALPLLPGRFDAAATALTPVEQPLVRPDTTATLAANFIGFISDADLPGRITLGDVDVILDGNTLVIGGTFSALAVGARVQVEGDVSSLGRIAASRITIF